MNTYRDEEIMRILIDNPDFTRTDAISELNGRYDDAYDPEGYRELCDILEEREMESHIEHIRSQGGDYWRNDAGEWSCG